MQPSIEQPEIQNRRLDRTGLALPGATCVVTGTGLGLHWHEALGWVFEHFWNLTELFFRSKLTPLTGSLDPLLTLVTGKVIVLQNKE